MADWLFTSQEAPVTEPPLPKDFGVGSKVIVISRSVRGPGPLPATVVKKGRVWVTVKPDDSEWQVLRFRLDTQSDGSDRGFPTFFRTPAQQRWHEVSTDAERYLNQIGIRFEEYRGRLIKAKMVELARLIYNSGLMPDPGKE